MECKALNDNYKSGICLNVVNTHDLLISKSILLATVRTFPGYPITGHAPLIFIHTFLTHGKPTPALPAKPKGFATAMTLF